MRVLLSEYLTMEDRYQGNVTIKILDDYCCSLRKGYKILKIEPNHRNNLLINEYYIINYVHYYLE